MNDEKFSLFPVASGIAGDLISPLETPVTMTSREIAELTGKEHKNVKRDIERMLNELDFDALSFERIYRDAKNREQIEFRLNKELTETLITGYSTKLRYQVVRRLNYLEDENRRLQAELLADLPAKVKNLAAKELSTLRPAVESLNKTQGGKTFAQKAKAVYELVEFQRRACSWRLEPAEAEALNQRIIHGLLDLGVLKPDGGLKAQVFTARYQDVMRLYAFECGAVVAGSQASP